MRLETLISCMHQQDASIATTSNVRSDAVIISQCDREESTECVLTDASGNTHQIKLISTKERGLSRSRNMAIANATADICLIADDDEVFEDDAAENIVKAFERHPEADLITFDIKGSHSTKTRLTHEAGRIGYLGALHISSIQITFRRKRIIEKGICFDPEMGSGTGHGCGEETKFLFDCLKKKLTIIHVPIPIASLSATVDSQWFQGWTPRFFLERGWATARYLGKPVATVYACYYAIVKRSKFKTDISAGKALKNMLKGIYSKTI